MLTVPFDWQRAYLAEAEALRANPEQWAAYESPGHCVVLAGPGSGKTKTLTIKMASILAKDVKPPRGVACITYSNECVRELTGRLGALGVRPGRTVSIGTLHSFCLKHVITPFARLVVEGYPDPIKVASRTDSDRCWAGAIGELPHHEQPSAFDCANYRRGILDRDSPEWQGTDEAMAQTVERYEARLIEQGLIDFDGMVLTALQLVESHPWIRRCLKARFPVLAVDEYQDLGPALHRMVVSLCMQGGIRLFAVGDPDQSIYGFQGSRPELLVELAEQENVETIRLRRNYRSGAAIIEAGELALGEERGIQSDLDEAGDIFVHHRPNGFDDQVRHACETIIPEALAEGRDRSEIALLYRDQFDGQKVADELDRRGLDYVRMDKGSPFPRTPMITWLEDCAAWCTGGWSDPSLALTPLIGQWLSFHGPALGESDRVRLRADLMRFLQANKEVDQPLGDWLDGMFAAGLEEALKGNPVRQDDWPLLTRLRADCEAGGALADQRVSGFGGQSGTPDHLNLMTLHAAKGLEFDVVIILGMEEGRVPSFRSTTADQLREERRLFYVGITRARHAVHVLYSGFYRNQYGRPFANGPSRFLDEIRARLEAE